MIHCKIFGYMKQARACFWKSLYTYITPSVNCHMHAAFSIFCHNRQLSAAKMTSYTVCAWRLMGIPSLAFALRSCAAPLSQPDDKSAPAMCPSPVAPVPAAYIVSAWQLMRTRSLVPQMCPLQRLCPPPSL